MQDCCEETISTLKFADRAKSILVKVQANEINAADDARILQLQKEVQYLKEILNLKRKGNASDVNQMLLQLKTENDKLRELKSENNILKSELHKYKV